MIDELVTDQQTIDWVVNHGLVSRVIIELFETGDLARFKPRILQERTRNIPSILDLRGGTITDENPNNSQVILWQRKPN